MASKKAKFTVGLFVAGGLCISVLAIVWLGMARYFEKGKFYVTYFNESVQGLKKDSPVKYRGVSIGRVESIGVAPDSKLIQVILKIESGQKLDHSIVAQLKNVGITGSMLVELDRKKKGEKEQSPVLSFPSEYPIVASKPSEINRLLSGLDDVLKHFQSIDLKGISDKLKLTLDNANLMMADADIKGISTKLQSSLTRAEHILKNRKWESILASVDHAAKSLDELMAKAGSSLAQVDRTLVRMEGFVARNEEPVAEAVMDLKKAMVNANKLLEKGAAFIGNTDDALNRLKAQLLVSAQNLELATEHLNRFLETLSDSPSQLLFGEPATPRALEMGHEAQ
ncbi:MAG: MlaD family protein [Deltaproteobacteria bacterium]|nr:MlaD family protein [Deltaproteobacteria bacterium]